jgi:hypothetical protein
MPTRLLPGARAKTDAERAREYRARRKANGLKDTRQRNRVQHNTRPTRWETGEFVAIDGEGFSEGPEFKVRSSSSGNVYTGKDHFYALLSASDGTEISAPDFGTRLTTADCLDFLCAIVERNENAIVVCFGGTYDFCHMVAHELSRDEISCLLGRGIGRRSVDVSFDGWQYRLEYRPRKSFTVRRWPGGVRKYERNDKGDWVPTKHTRVTVWDVHGFFQARFEEVMDKWIPGDPDYEFIKRMKKGRSIFLRSELSEIRRYNQAELRCLVKIMEGLRAAINDLGLKITRWDGAGAIAAAFLRKHRVRSHKRSCSGARFDAVRTAYSGGHIEMYKLGFHHVTIHGTEIHHYDKNSAYPDEFRRLPCLRAGRWVHGSGESAPGKGFTLFRLRFELPWGAPFYPLFFRQPDGSIIYPPRGTGWYWRPEFDAARAWVSKLGGTLEVMEWWHYEEPDDLTIRPFGWVDDYYSHRQTLIEDAKKRGVISGAEKVIKLGLNSLYGKTAQQVGWKIDDAGNVVEPTYFQLEWAGWVTSGCRAALMEAAVQNPSAIIAIATDGIFSTAPLDLECPARKELGKWEYKKHAGITVVMPGVYYLHEYDEKVNFFTRGFKRKEFGDVEIIHRAWRSKKDTIEIDITRLIGLGSASLSPDFWRMRGCWVQSVRKLALDGDNSKRYPVMLYNCDPSKGLIDTVPRDHLIGDNLFVDELQSAPYPIAWMGERAERDLLEGERIEELEMMDAELA